MKSMLTSSKVRLLSFPFHLNVIEGVLVAAKDVRPQSKHDELDIPNLYVLKLLNSLKSRGYVREIFNWYLYH